MQVTYGGAGQRFVAALLDGIVVAVAGGLVGMVLGLVGAGTQSVLSTVLSTVLSFIISIGYYVFYQKQATQTLGKKVMGLRVVDAQGNTPSLMTFFLREVIGKIVSAVILMIGYLMILWDGRKQGLHDKIAGTFVIKVQSEQAAQPQQPIAPAA